MHGKDAQNTRGKETGLPTNFGREYRSYFKTDTYERKKKRKKGKKTRRRRAVCEIIGYDHTFPFFNF
jgi:hypothetical protein